MPTTSTVTRLVADISSFFPTKRPVPERSANMLLDSVNCWSFTFTPSVFFLAKRAFDQFWYLEMILFYFCMYLSGARDYAHFGASATIDKSSVFQLFIVVRRTGNLFLNEAFSHMKQFLSFFLFCSNSKFLFFFSSDGPFFRLLNYCTCFLLILAFCFQQICTLAFNHTVLSAFKTVLDGAVTLMEVDPHQVFLSWVFCFHFIF